MGYNQDAFDLKEIWEGEYSLTLKMVRKNNNWEFKMDLKTEIWEQVSGMK